MPEIVTIEDGVQKIVVLTDDMEAMEQLVELFNALIESKGVEKLGVLKALEIWAYRHPKELNQIKSQLQWRFEPNA